MGTPFEPPFVTAAEAARHLGERGFAVLDPSGLGRIAGQAVDALAQLTPAWENLPRDEYLRDGGRYRSRRHGSFRVGAGRVEAVPHRAHWQSEDYNALHGGIERWFEPLQPQLSGAPSLRGLLLGFAALFNAVRPAPTWFVEAHAFRIDTTGGIGRPTPEGAHRDGVDFVAVLLVARVSIKGGETRVFDAHGPAGQRFTLHAPWSALVLDDSRVVHETTPIQPLDGDGHRDTLVLTYRRDGFQDPPTG